MEVTLTQTLNPNQYYMYAMVNPLFSTFRALISSNFWPYMLVCVENVVITLWKSDHAHLRRAHNYPEIQFQKRGHDRCYNIGAIIRESDFVIDRITQILRLQPLCKMGFPTLIYAEVFFPNGSYFLMDYIVIRTWYHPSDAAGKYAYDIQKLP